MTPSPRLSPGPGAHRLDSDLRDALVQTTFLVSSILGDVADDHDLSVTQLRLLGVLRDREPRMSHLAQLLGLTKSSVTGLVDRAQQRGLLRRVSIPVGDERAVHVELTETARELIAEISDETAVRIAAVTEVLSDAARAQLCALLSELVAHQAELHQTDLTPSRPLSAAQRP